MQPLIYINVEGLAWSRDLQQVFPTLQTVIGSLQEYVKFYKTEGREYISYMLYSTHNTILLFENIINFHEARSSYASRSHVYASYFETRVKLPFYRL